LLIVWFLTLFLGEKFHYTSTLLFVQCSGNFMAALVMFLLTKRTGISPMKYAVPGFESLKKVLAFPLFVSIHYSSFVDPYSFPLPHPLIISPSLHLYFSSSLPSPPQTPLLFLFLLLALVCLVFPTSTTPYRLNDFVNV
jgi:hypothetical protein